MMPSAFAGPWSCQATSAGVSNLKTSLATDEVQQALLFRGKTTTYVVVVTAQGRTLLSLSPSGKGRAETSRRISASDLEGIVASGGTNVLRVKGASLKAVLERVATGTPATFDCADDGALKVNGEVVELEEAAALAGTPAGSPAAETPAAR